MKSSILLSSLICLLCWGHSQAQTDDYDPYAHVGFLIIHSGKDYPAALGLAKDAAASMELELRLRDLSPVEGGGLTFPKEICEEEFGEGECYVARGRYDDGLYVSIEHTDAYGNFTAGYYIVVVWSGPAESKERRALLRKVRSHYPDAYLKNSKIYMGCMH